MLSSPQIISTKQAILACFLLVGIMSLISCNKNNFDHIIQWQRHVDNPILEDLIEEGNYQSASDGHIFFDENDQLKMIYSGDDSGASSIKLASGTDWTTWEKNQSLLSEIGPSQLDKHKETAFYRRSSNGKHQIYYIGYSDGTSYEAQIFLAESENLTGPYLQQLSPIIPKGNIAGKEVYCMTSPSIIEHQEILYMVFIGWNASPNDVSEVWVLGATSNDDGKSWSNFQEIDCPIGMEGQITKIADNEFVAVRTSDYEDREAIFYATATHPFGPWILQEEPILIRENQGLERHEIIAPQITVDPISKDEYLYYTGANHLRGWWMMMATPD